MQPSLTPVIRLSGFIIPIAPAPTATEQLRRTEGRRGQRTRVRKCFAHRGSHSHRALVRMGHTSLMTDGVRIGPDAEGMEVMGLLGVMGFLNMRRCTGWKERTLVDLIPQLENSHWLTPRSSCRTLHPRLFDHAYVDHVQNGYACASPSSPPVYARRLTRARLEYPRASPQSNQLCSPTQHRRPSLPLAIAIENEYP